MLVRCNECGALRPALEFVDRRTGKVGHGWPGRCVVTAWRGKTCPGEFNPVADPDGTREAIWRLTGVLP